MQAGHPGRLLLVCGDRADARRMKACLEAHTPFDVTVAHDGRTGWVLSQAGRFTVLIGDADLPDFPGLELLCQSKTLSPGVPTLLLTEHDPVALALDELSFAVDAVLRRPCADEQLLVALARLVGPHAVHPAPRVASLPALRQPQAVSTGALGTAPARSEAQLQALRDLALG